MTSSDLPGSNWDFFVSYTQEDRAWAEWISWTLEEDGHRVLVQSWDFVGGTNWIRQMQDGVSNADRTIALLSSAYTKSVYGAAEWQAAWAADPDGVGRKLLVVRLAECKRPGLMAGVVTFDVFGVSEAVARNRIRSMVRGALAGRAKPSRRPDFPGHSRAVLTEPRFPGSLPRIWNVPARNPYFTGRRENLTELGRELAASPLVAVRSLRGMGGVGKTQLAIEYAYLHATDYDLVWWITAEQQASIPDQVTCLATVLGLDTAIYPSVLLTAVHTALRDIPGWLLVFDNAEDAESLRPWIPTGIAPQGHPAHVLVTTRRHGYSHLGRVLDIDVLPEPEAREFLRLRLPDLDKTCATSICVELGCLPLALEQAAGYMRLTSLSGPDYLRLLRSRGIDLYGRGRVAGREETIATLWDLVLARIERDHVAALQLLEICAWLAPEPIPLNLLTAYPDLLPIPLRDTTLDMLEFTDTLAVLIDYSLLKRTGDSVLMHRIVQAVVRNYTRDYMSTTNDGTHHPLAVARSLLRAGAPETITRAPQDWPTWRVLLPHVLVVASQSCPAERIADDDALWLITHAATYLRIQGRLQDARPLAEKALSLAEQIHGSEHVETGLALHDLALVLWDLGKMDEARKYGFQSLSVLEVSCGSNHPAIATVLISLTRILRYLGEELAAEPLAERAVAITEVAYGPDHPEVAVALNELARVYRYLGKPEPALPLAERARVITEAAYGRDHPRFAFALSNLAGTYRALGELDRARSLYEQALVIDEVAYGVDHPELAIRVHNLAEVLRELGDPGAARPLAERALSITEKTYGPDHPTIRWFKTNLAALETRDCGRMHHEGQDDDPGS